jgi:hypothetical protein
MINLQTEPQQQKCAISTIENAPKEVQQQKPPISEDVPRKSQQQDHTIIEDVRKAAHHQE